MNQAALLLADALGADKVDAMRYDPTVDTLVALGTSDTPMGHRQHALGLNRMPLSNGGRAVQVFQTGAPHRSGHVDDDPDELPGLFHGLGIRSQIITPLELAGERSGVLLASSAQAEFFSADDLDFLVAVARWVGMVGHRADLTEQIAREAVEHGRRLAADELVTALAHDLGNHLTPLKARLDLIRRRAEREGHQRQHHDAVEAAKTLGRMQRLIADLLDTARIDQGLFAVSPHMIDLATLAAETAAEFQTQATPIVVRGPDEACVTADEERMRQALENLLTNALKHSPDGEPITDEVATEERTDGVWAVVTVADRGPGVPAEVLPRLFTRFAAGTNSTGLGLGLYMAERIAAAHGGTLTVDSAPGEGARFTLALPGAEVSDTTRKRSSTVPGVNGG
jgi:signal transduction histidine kinase